MVCLLAKQAIANVNVFSPCLVILRRSITTGPDSYAVDAASVCEDDTQHKTMFSV